jgi:hypothetical protein
VGGAELFEGTPMNDNQDNAPSWGTLVGNPMAEEWVRIAVAAERERCAALVESIAVSDSNSGNLYYAGPFRTHAARRIREGDEPE